MSTRNYKLWGAADRRSDTWFTGKQVRRRRALGLMTRAAAGIGMGGALAAIGLPASASARNTSSFLAREFIVAKGTYPRVFMTGDSLTWGSVASMPNNAYSWQVITGLRARGSQQAMFYRVDGQTGINTSGDILALQVMNDLPVADLLIVEVGVADWGQNADPATFQAQYVSLLQMLVQTSPAARLIALTCWQDPAALNSRGDSVALFNQIITDAALNKAGAAAASVLSLGPFFLNSANHNTTGDTYHPNDAGHQAIATGILGLLP